MDFLPSFYIFLNSISCNVPQKSLEFLVASINVSHPTPAAFMHIKTITLPPSCFAGDSVHLPLSSSPDGRHPRLITSSPKQFVNLSRKKRKLFQDSFFLLTQISAKERWLDLVPGRDERLPTSNASMTITVFQTSMNYFERMHY